MPLLLDIITYLTVSGAVAGDGIDAFRDFIPDKPDNVVSLIEYKGSPTVFYDEHVNRSIQVSVRNTDADAARVKAKQIFDLLQPTTENGRVDFTPTRFGQVYLRQTPFLLGRDKNDRITYCFNVGITTTIE